MANSILDKTVASLRKKYSESLADVEKVGTVKKLPVASPKMNYLLGGGIPLGRIMTILGPESVGKTTLATYLGGEIQRRKDGGPSTILYIDMEHAFDANHAKNVGLDLADDKFIFVRPLHGEEGFTICEELVKTGLIGAIIWDSVAATPSAASVESEYGKACVSPETEVEFRLA